MPHIVYPVSCVFSKKWRCVLEASIGLNPYCIKRKITLRDIFLFLRKHFIKLLHTRYHQHSLWCEKSKNCPPLHQLLLKILGSPPAVQVKFILDSRAFPELIRLVQTHGQELLDRVMYFTRTFAFAIHMHMA